MNTILNTKQQHRIIAQPKPQKRFGTLHVNYKIPFAVSVLFLTVFLGSLAYVHAHDLQAKSQKVVSTNKIKSVVKKKKAAALANTNAKFSNVQNKNLVKIADCRSCTDDTSCPSRYTCSTVNIGEITERVCTKKCVNSASCPSGYGCGSDQKPAVRNVCWPYKANSSTYSSCKAVLNQGKKCVDSGECGYSNELRSFAGSACSEIENNICRLFCNMGNSRSCTTGYKCGCPVEYSYDSQTKLCMKINTTGVHTRARCMKNGN